MWVAMLQCKSDAFEAFKHFKSLAETEKELKIKTLRSDRGGEFISKEFSKHSLEHGIKRQLTTPYSPQQNGVVERKNRTVMSTVRAMLKAKDLPRELLFLFLIDLQQKPCREILLTRSGQGDGELF